MDNQKIIEKTDKKIEGLKGELTEVKHKENFNQILVKMKTQIARALPKHLTVERMTRVVQTAYSSNSKLQECDPYSIIAGVMQSSQLGLEVNTALGQAYLIPYKNNKTGTIEAQFQIGYQGIIELAYRSGLYKHISAYSVYENDEFYYEYGLNRQCVHKPNKEQTGEPTYYYAVYKTANGGEDFLVMSKEQIERHARKYSSAFKSGYNSPWKTEFDMMAKKTVIKQLLKYAPKSIEVCNMIYSDETIKKDVKEDMMLADNLMEYDDSEIKEG